MKCYPTNHWKMSSVTIPDYNFDEVIRTILKDEYIESMAWSIDNIISIVLTDEYVDSWVWDIEEPEEPRREFFMCYKCYQIFEWYELSCIFEFINIFLYFVVLDINLF